MKAGGAIAFARFMQLALYCPVYGYYEKEEDRIGRHGDYYTSVSVGRLFGELLAFQFAQWLESESKRETGAVQIVEAGAHDGRLAKDILTWLREHRPKLFHQLEYWIVEPSPTRQQWQQQTLAEFSTQTRFVTELGIPSPVPHLSRRLAAPKSDEGGSQAKADSPLVHGIIFANELLDAMPVHRLGWDAKTWKWFEWGVTLSEGQFVWKRMEDGEKPEVRGQKSEVRGQKPAHWGIPELPKALLDVLPDGFTVELCPARTEWWRQAASALKRGKLLTIDYGLEADEFFAPERKEGTLRAYCRHQLTCNVLADPGEQDITAHVNFTAIQAAGEAAGLKTDGFLTQAQFLTAIAAQIWNGGASFGEWGSERARQFQTLTHPEHLGRAFRVLVQSRASTKSGG